MGFSAGLDKTAEFDEYTIYADNERKPKSGAAGMDKKADFDEYTIYDQGREINFQLFVILNYNYTF